MASSVPQRRFLSRYVPLSQRALVIALIAVSIVDSVLLGYDSSLMGSLNVMPTYKSYFALTTATKSLNTASSYVGGSCSALFAGFLVDYLGRTKCIYISAYVTLVGAVIQSASQNIGMFIAGRFIVGKSQLLLEVLTSYLRSSKLRNGHSTGCLSNIRGRDCAIQVSPTSTGSVLRLLVGWYSDGFWSLLFCKCRGFEQQYLRLIGILDTALCFDLGMTDTKSGSDLAQFAVPCRSAVLARESALAYCPG